MGEFILTTFAGRIVLFVLVVVVLLVSKSGGL